MKRIITKYSILYIIVSTLVVVSLVFFDKWLLTTSAVKNDLSVEDLIFFFCITHSFTYLLYLKLFPTKDNFE